MVVPELNCCALDSFRLFTVSSPQIEEDPFEYIVTGVEIEWCKWIKYDKRLFHIPETK
jgi:hypothetical protein